MEGVRKSESSTESERKRDGESGMWAGGDEETGRKREKRLQN